MVKTKNMGKIALAQKGALGKGRRVVTTARTLLCINRYFSILVNAKHVYTAFSEF
jgi:hypothetical protein